MKPKKILLVTSEFPPQPGGIGNHSYYLATYLMKAGKDVVVITDQRSQQGNEERIFDANCNFKVVRIKRERFIAKTYVRRIQALFKNNSSECLVIASGKFSLWAVAFLTFFKKCKTVGILHGTEINYKNPILKKSIEFSLKRLGNLIAVSNFTKSLVSDLNLPITVIPNGIVNNDWQVTADKTSSKPKGEPSFLTVGRISDRKGQFKVVSYLPELIKNWPDLCYHCIGLDSEGARLKVLAESLGVGSYLSIHGPLTNEDLKQFLSKVDIVLMLSQNTNSGDVEGFGIAALEANALGIPVIGSRNTGLEEAIEDFKSGRLVDSENYSEVEAAIIEILHNKTAYSHNSVLWAKRHDWSKIIQQYLNVLE